MTDNRQISESELRVADRVLRNAVNAMWSVATAAIVAASAGDTQTDTDEPLDPHVPKLFDNLTAWWKSLADEDKDETTPIFEFEMLVDGDSPYPGRPNSYIKGFHRITVGDLIQLRARDRYAEKTRAELADKCAEYRSQRDEARQQSAARLSLLTQAAADGEEAVKQRDRLYETLREVLSGHWESGHPGYAALRTFWIYAATVQKWHTVLASTPRPEPVERSVELHTPVVWCERYDVEVRDPDGWRTPDAPSWDTPITLDEFWRRFGRSTVRPLSQRTLGEIHDQLIADLRAARTAQG